MDYEQKYNKLVEAVKVLQEINPSDEGIQNWVNDNVPELRESEDERIRKEILEYFQQFENEELRGVNISDWLAWLEKQVLVDEDEIVKGIRRGVAISLMNYIDANSKGMCLSNMECEDIENAIVNEDWNKVYGYMKKKLEKQGEQKSNPCDGCINRKGCINCENGELREVEQKPAWSEEDKEIQNTTISFLSEYAAKGYENAVMCIDWLKSLKQRIGWKPSEEQMKALDSVIDEYDGYPEFDSLVSLKNDLKKL